MTGLLENIVELLRKIDTFSQLREYELDIIAPYCEFIEIKKGQPIFSQGSPSNELYVIERGRVGIISVDNDDDIGIAQIEAGESFGELDFLGGTKRSAAAFAEEDSTLLKFPSQRFTSNDIARKHPYISANILYRLSGIISERIWNVNNLLRDKTGWLQDLQKQLLCDKMTGLYNETYLKEDFLNLLPDLGASAALLIIKPDNFKEINDKYGHDAGDHVLNIMAIFLQSELREDDIGIRYHGNEFAAILLNTDKDDAIRIAKEIHATFKAMTLSRIIGSDDIRIKVSIGIALYPDNSDNSKMLVDIAHKRMLKAKDMGGNTIIS